MMVAPGWRLQHVARPQHQELVAPQDAALAVDRADAVAVAVEGDAEIAAALLHLGHELHEVLRHGRIGMVRREGAVDLLVQHEMLARQLVDDGTDRHADRAVADVPRDLELLAGLDVAQEPRRVVGQDVLLLRLALAAFPVALARQRAQRLDVGAEERLLAHHHLEAVVVRRIVRAGDLDAAVGIEVVDGEIEHRRRRHADVGDVDAGGRQAFDAGGGQFGRAQPAVIAQRHAATALAADHRAEGAADGARVGGMHRVADDAADVVLAQDGGVELVRRLAHANSGWAWLFSCAAWAGPRPHRRNPWPRISSGLKMLRRSTMRGWRMTCLIRRGSRPRNSCHSVITTSTSASKAAS